MFLVSRFLIGCSNQCLQRSFFFSFFLFLAEITLPAFGNLTFISEGTDVTLPWTYNFGSALVTLVDWRFSKTGNPGSFKQLAALPATGEPIILNDTFSGISVIRPATLVLQNVNLDHNGTYRISFNLFGPGVTSPQTTDIFVIVLGKKLITLCVALIQIAYLLFVAINSRN